MPKKMAADKVQRLEGQAVAFIEKIWKQTREKKTWARVITAAVILIAVWQEFFTETQLTNSWREITTYIMAGYFGTATIRKVLSRTAKTEGGNL